MKKKVLSIVLVLALVFTCFTACGKKEADPTPTTQPTATQAPTSTPVPTAAAEALPEAKYHWGFDGNDTGIVSVVRRDKNDTETANTDFGGTYGIEAAASYTDKDGNVLSTDALYADGPVGKCLYLNGNFGLKLDNFKGMADESYTISFWVNADRLSTFGPVIQLGHNVAMNSSVSWINFTQSEWGTSSAKIFPVVWNRNVDDNGAFPWFYASDDAIHGKKEWVLVTLVADGQTYTYGEGDSAYTLVNSTLYLNGEQVFYSDMSAYGGLATEVISDKFADSTELLIGINYWDSLFKGFIDELYIFEEALTAGQVQTLFQQGDLTVKSTAPTAGGAEPTEAPEPTPIDHSNVVTTGTVVGNKECTTGFWTEFSPIWAVPAGETKTVKLQTYTDGMANWHGPAVILQNTATGHAAADADGYKEYGVVRMDNWGWNATADTGNLAALGWVLENNWNWETFKTALDNATVTISVTNNGTTADVVINAVTAEGDEFAQSYKNIAVDGDLYFCFTVEAAFAEIISHQDVKTTGTLVGTLDCATGFWTAFSDIWEVPANGSKTVKFVNYTSRVANWNNFVAILQNTPTGHAAADAEGYKEYAVVRADNWGWNATADTGNIAALGWVLESNWDWTTFKTDLDGATVELTATNNGTTAEVVATITTTYGKVYTQSYKNIAVDGPVYLTLTVDGAAIDIQ